MNEDQITQLYEEGPQRWGLWHVQAKRTCLLGSQYTSWRQRKSSLWGHESPQPCSRLARLTSLPKKWCTTVLVLGLAETRWKQSGEVKMAVGSPLSTLNMKMIEGRKWSWIWHLLKNLFHSMEPPKNKEQMLLLVQMEKRCLDMTECGWGRMSMTWVGPYKIIFIFSQIPLNFFPNSGFSV